MITKKFTSYITLLPVLLLTVILITGSCKKDVLITDTNAKLRLSADTILFDTVFTTIGSTTLQLKAYNDYDQPIQVTNIQLAGGKNSNFRINIDGVPTTEIQDIEIPANDSIYIFIKVTVDPNNSNSPLVINDSILFNTNGNLQKVQLVAWGQDAYYHTPNLPIDKPWYSVIDRNSIWTNDKPHVIYGYAVVDSASTLTIQEGSKIHFHKNGVLWVYKGGTLKVEGKPSNEVVFQGDRMEQYYKEIPGQWRAIWLSSGSINNTIDYAIIKNGTIGIQADTLGSPLTQPTLKLTNTIIRNMSTAGVLGQGTWIEAYNCVISNCGQYAVALNIGGFYDFKHCTIGNYWNFSTRQTSSVFLNNYYQDSYNNYHIRELYQATFANCIIHGSIAEEIQLDSFPNIGKFNYKFDHCLLKTETKTSNTTHFINCLINSSPGFINAYEHNFELSAGSASINQGSVAVGAAVRLDILGHDRTIDIAPDLGAYEKY